LISLSGSAYAELTSQTEAIFLREKGEPTQSSVSLDMKYSGELRIANVNLQDDAIEIAESTEISLNGSRLFPSFSLPNGGLVVFPLTSGRQVLDVTLRGKPGGGVRVEFLEDIPVVAPIRKGWEVLEDDTALHKKTGLIWHRNAASPGFSLSDICPDAYKNTRYGCTYTISEYISDLNSGVYGYDCLDGNCGHSDWRAPTIEEFYATVDLRVTFPPLEGKNGEINIRKDVVEGDYALYGVRGGMQFGDPIFVCNNNESMWEVLDKCDPKYDVEHLITNSLYGGESRPDFPDWGFVSVSNWPYAGQFPVSVKRGHVWPVRG